MRNFAALVAILGLTFSLSATAAGGPQGGGPQGGEMPSFTDFDENGDGMLSREEVKGPLADDFDRIDADGDGFISEEEMPKGPPQGQGRPQN